MAVLRVDAAERVTLGCPWCPLIPFIAAAGAAAATQTDLGSDILEGIPGGSVVAEGIRKLIAGPLRDFANTPLGKTVLRAVATAAYSSGVAWAGPQLAALTFALPGLARGESFTKAWATEFLWRVEKLAEIFGVSEAKQIALDQAKTAVEELWREYGGDEQLERLWQEYGKEPFDRLVKRLSARLELRQDAVAAALSGMLGIEPPPKAEWFDPGTGALLSYVERAGVYRATSTAVQTTFTRSVLPYGGRLSTVGSSAFLAAGTYRPDLAPVLEHSAAPPPPPSAPSSSTRETAGQVALVTSLGAAAAAFVWFYVGKP